MCGQSPGWLPHQPAQGDPTGIRTTAHILADLLKCDSAGPGAIDRRHRLFVIVGAAISTNPGAKISPTITALAAQAMMFIPAKVEAAR